jgi:hypothetical protein
MNDKNFSEVLGVAIVAILMVATGWHQADGLTSDDCLAKGQLLPREKNLLVDAGTTQVVMSKAITLLK